MNFFPGLVGGHCIGVDPYYLTYKAEQLGYHSQVILSGRRINDDMGRYVAENLIKSRIKADIPVKGARVAVLGFTFKENCPDTRNTRVIDIVNELKEFGIDPIITDPEANKEEAKRQYGIELHSMDDIIEMDAIMIAVAHDRFLNYKQEDFNKMFKKSDDQNRVMIDIKGILDSKEYESAGYRYWRL